RCKGAASGTAAALAGRGRIAIIGRSLHGAANALGTRGIPMKLVLTLLGVVLLVIATVYFLVPADQLPGFFPGHEAGVTHVHTKHGIVAGVIGLVLIGAGTFMG